MTGLIDGDWYQILFLNFIKFISNVLNILRNHEANQIELMYDGLPTFRIEGGIYKILNCL